MGLISTGIAKIELADIAQDGGVGTVFKALGYTVEGTANLTTDDPTETEFLVEEVDTAIDTDVKEGSMTVNFTVADPDEDTLVSVFGGTKTGTGEDAVFEYPEVLPIIEKSIKLTPRKGMGITIVRAKMTAKFSADIGRGKLMGIEVSGKVLQPTKTGVKKFTTFRVK